MVMMMNTELAELARRFDATGECDEARK